MDINEKDIVEPIPQFELDSDSVSAMVSTLTITSNDIIVVHLVGDSMDGIQSHVQKTVSLFDKAGFKNPIIFMNADSYIMCVNEASVDLKATLEKLAADSDITKDEEPDFDISDVLGRFK